MSVLKVKDTIKGIIAFCFETEDFVRRAVDHDFQLEIRHNKQFRQTVEHDPEAENNYKRERDGYVRNTLKELRQIYYKSFVLVSCTIVLAWLTTYILYRWLGPAPPWLLKGLQVVSGGILLAATFSKLGWRFRTWSGESFIEKINQSLYRCFYILGTFLLMLALLWPSKQ